MSIRRLTAAALAALALAGCIDLSTNPSEIVAIEFGPLAYPAIVMGDSLRDSTGAVRALDTKLIDGAGNVVTKSTVTYVSLDTILSVTSAGVAIAHGTAGTARIVASGGGLQSQSRSIDVVARPDSLAVDNRPDTLRLGIPDDPAVNITGEFRLKLLSKTTTPPTATKSWIVRYGLRYQGADVAPGDTSLLWLVNEQGRPAVADTTDAQGVISRRVRFKLVPGKVPALDSVIVTVTASYKGALVLGAPARMVVAVKPK
ncbi:MAG: hypothetical protein U0163_07435 [Gemmatimonadaceae bacterium]